MVTQTQIDISSIFFERLPIFSWILILPLIVPKLFRIFSKFEKYFDMFYP
jgi:hypothetical protein